MHGPVVNFGLLDRVSLCCSQVQSQRGACAEKEHRSAPTCLAGVIGVTRRQTTTIQFEGSIETLGTTECNTMHQFGVAQNSKVRGPQVFVYFSMFPVSMLIGSCRIPPLRDGWGKAANLEYTLLLHTHHSRMIMPGL